MEDVKVKAKKKVLEEIMSLMDEHMSEGLKSKSPKFMSVEMGTAKPAEEMMPEGEEDVTPSPEMEMDEDMSDEDKMRLKELYEKHCR